MSNRPKKVVILGLDAPIPSRFYKFCKEGKLPNLARIINNGVWARNAMVPLPTITPSNWTSIATGAWPSTHGVTDFNVHTPGSPLDCTHAGFYSGDVKAEWLWNAIARAGKKSIVVNYPATWPPTTNDGITIGGGGVEVNMWFYPTVLLDDVTKWGSPPPNDKDLNFRFAQHGTFNTVPGGEGAPIPRLSLSAGALFVGRRITDTPEPKEKTSSEESSVGQRIQADLGLGTPVELKEPTGWSNLPQSAKILEGHLPAQPVMNRYAMDPWEFDMLVLDTEGDGYDKILICEAKDASSPIAELRESEWGPIITREFRTEAGLKRGAFTFKLLELSNNADRFRLYQTDICALDGWSHPESVSEEISSEKGLPLIEIGFHLLDFGLIDIDTVMEMAELQQRWFSDACTYLLKNKPWDLFIMHYHLPDHAWHSISRKMDPITAASEAELKKFQEVELKIYEICDRLAADLMECNNDEDTLYAIISDHGAKTANPEFYDANDILQKAGLQVRDEAGEVVWSQTRAIAQRSIYAYVNLEGRDPEGIVKPGEEYREVQDQIIKAMTEYVDPDTGIKPVLFAMRKEDARFINMHGDYIGDVIFAAGERFGNEHGTFLPTAEWGMGSLNGVFSISGPGIKKGMELERNVWCVDLVPTICYITGWPVPKDTEGSVIYQALEEPGT